MERTNDRRTANLASQPFTFSPLINVNVAIESWGNVGDAGSIGVFQGAV